MSDNDKTPPGDPDQQTKRRRPKRSEGFDLLGALSEPIAVRQDGKTKKVSSFEAGLLKTVMKAVGGNLPAIKYVLRLAVRHRQVQSPEPHRSVVVVPKDMPEELQSKIWEYRADEDGEEAMHRIYCAFADWFDWKKSRNPKKDEENDRS